MEAGASMGEDTGSSSDLGDGSEPGPDPVVLADPPPPPISGGTLLLSLDGTLLFAADPDRDAVHVVDVASERKLHSTELPRGSEPGRVVEAPDGLLHVALRRSGAVATIDPTSGELLVVRPVCGNPRGIAVDPEDDSILVTCAEGILARLHRDDSVERLDIGIELRDVVDVGPLVRVSTFRDARVLTLDAAGAITEAQAPRAIGVKDEQFEDLPASGSEDMELDDVMEPNTARRTIGTAGGGWLMLHQAATTRVLSSTSTAYYRDDGCIPVQATALTSVAANGTQSQAWPLRHIAPAFDFAATADLSSIVAVGSVAESWALVLVDEQSATPPPPGEPCRDPATIDLPGEPTAVTFDDQQRAWVQLREPAALVVLDLEAKAVVAGLLLADTSVRDSGHELFHQPTPSMVACVSCHPEGREDGRVWSFSDLGQRRTQTLDIGLEGSDPFHWRGEQADFAALVVETFEERMGGPELREDEVAALARWVYALPVMTAVPRGDSESIDRGRKRFEELGCAACHAGPKLTNNATMLMGWYGFFQVPSLLGVAFRAPYMHHGRAADLEAAVVEMHGFAQPGVEPSPQDVSDLVAFLESLGAD